MPDKIDMPQTQEELNFDTLLHNFCGGKGLVNHLVLSIIPPSWLSQARQQHHRVETLNDGMLEASEGIKNLLPQISSLGINYTSEILFLNYDVLINNVKEEIYQGNIKDILFSEAGMLEKLEEDRVFYEKEYGVTPDEWNKILLDRFKREDEEKERKYILKLRNHCMSIRSQLEKEQKRAVFVTSVFKYPEIMSECLGVPVISPEFIRAPKRYTFDEDILVFKITDSSPKSL